MYMYIVGFAYKVIQLYALTHDGNFVLSWYIWLYLNKCVPVYHINVKLLLLLSLFITYKWTASIEKISFVKDSVHKSISSVLLFRSLISYAGTLCTPFSCSFRFCCRSFFNPSSFNARAKHSALSSATVMFLKGLIPLFVFPLQLVQL